VALNRIVIAFSNASRSLDSFWLMLKSKLPRHTEDINTQGLAHPSKRRWIRILEWTIAIFGILIGLLGLYLNYAPKLSMDTSGSLRPHDPTGTVFYLSNDGLLSLYDVTATCGIDNIETQGGGRISGFALQPTETHADVLSPGHKMTLPCAQAIVVDLPIGNAKMTVRVRYRPAFVWWHKTEKFPLEAMKTRDGNWIWKNLPE
jgi:hypothetical protein